MGDEGGDSTMASSSIEAITRGEVDVQVATAKRYPRSITTFLKDARTLVTQSQDVAASCCYALQRQDKSGKPVFINGPSVRLAEIVASSWGNLRVGSQISEIGDEFIVARGVAWDLEKNVAVHTEVSRRIVNKYGKRFGADMIGTTGNAAVSIALRNAVFRVVPKPLVMSLYEDAKLTATGGAKTLGEQIQAMFAYFAGMHVTPEMIFGILEDVKGIPDINLDHLVTLKALAKQIKSGEMTIEQVFAPNKEAAPKGASAVADKIKGKSELNPETQTSPKAPDATPAPAPAPAPAPETTQAPADEAPSSDPSEFEPSNGWEACVKALAVKIGKPLDVAAVVAAKFLKGRNITEESLSGQDIDSEATLNAIDIINKHKNFAIYIPK